MTSFWHVARVLTRVGHVSGHVTGLWPMWVTIKYYLNLSHVSVSNYMVIVWGRHSMPLPITSAHIWTPTQEGLKYVKVILSHFCKGCFVTIPPTHPARIHWNVESFLVFLVAGWKISYNGLVFLIIVSTPGQSSSQYFSDILCTWICSNILQIQK